MSNNNNNQKENNAQRAERTIRRSVLWSMGAGAIPLPVLDALAVAAVQLDMVRELASIYEIDFKETQGKAYISALAGSALAKLGANALIKAIPVVGSIVGGVSMAAVSGASTYAVGQVFKAHFSAGGTFLDFDTSRFKKFYDEQFEKGKQAAEEIKREEETQKPPTAATNNNNPQPAPAAETRTEIKVEGAATNPTQTPPAANPAASPIVQKLKELAELREMGVINDDEFIVMKTRLIENYKG